MALARSLSLVVGLALLLTLPGCDGEDHKDDRRRMRPLEQRRDELQAQLDAITRGKAVLTEEEKARAAPIYLELREIELSREGMALRNGSP